MEAVLLGLCGITLLILIGVGILLRRCCKALQVVTNHLDMIQQGAEGQMEVLDRLGRVSRVQADQMVARKPTGPPEKV